MGELAKLLYEAYGASAEWKNYRGDPMPTWDALPENIQRHWRAVAAEAERQVAYSE